MNPWNGTGGLVDLRDHPRLAACLRPHRARLPQRHTAKADPRTRWYKTIDRITPSLAWQPKLPVPDIRGEGDAIAYDDGTVCPHHDPYHITSRDWSLRASRAMLRSGLARLFVEAYAARIGSSYLRFRAQSLRRIHIPAWESLNPVQQDESIDAGTAGSRSRPRPWRRSAALNRGVWSSWRSGDESRSRPVRTWRRRGRRPVLGDQSRNRRSAQASGNADQGERAGSPQARIWMVSSIC